MFHLKWLPKCTLLAPLFTAEESVQLLLVLPSSGPSRWCKSELHSWCIGSSGPARLVCSHAHTQTKDPTVAWCCTFYMLTEIPPPSKLLTHQIASLPPRLGRWHVSPCYGNLPAQGDLLLRRTKCSWSWPIQGPLGLQCYWLDNSTSPLMIFTQCFRLGMGNILLAQRLSQFFCREALACTDIDSAFSLLQVAKNKQALAAKGQQATYHSIRTKAFLIWRLQRFHTGTLFKCHQHFIEHCGKHFSLCLSPTYSHRTTWWDRVCHKQQLQRSSPIFCACDTWLPQLI